MRERGERASVQACPHFSIQKKNARPHKSSNVWKCNAVWKQTSLSDKIRFLSVSMSSGEEEKRRKIRKKNARGLDTRKSILSVYNISGATARMPSSCVLLLLAKCTSVFAVVFFSFSHHIFHWHCAQRDTRSAVLGCSIRFRIAQLHCCANRQAL